jgi:ATP-binding cassette subfamily B protein
MTADQITNKTTFDMRIALTARNRFAGLWRLMTGYRLIYLGAALALGIAAVSKTGTYLLLRYFTDNILGQPDSNYLLPWVAAAFIGVAVLEGCFTYLSGRMAAYTAEGITRQIRNYLFDHIQHLPFYYFDQTQTGDLIQRSTSDVDAFASIFRRPGYRDRANIAALPGQFHCRFI